MSTEQGHNPVWGGDSFRTPTGETWAWEKAKRRLVEDSACYKQSGIGAHDINAKATHATALMAGSAGCPGRVPGHDCHSSDRAVPDQPIRTDRLISNSTVLTGGVAGAWKAAMSQSATASEGIERDRPSVPTTPERTPERRARGRRLAGLRRDSLESISGGADHQRGQQSRHGLSQGVRARPSRRAKQAARANEVAERGDLLDEWLCELGTAAPTTRRAILAATTADAAVQVDAEDPQVPKLQQLVAELHRYNMELLERNTDLQLDIKKLQRLTLERQPRQGRPNGGARRSTVASRDARSRARRGERGGSARGGGARRRSASNDVQQSTTCSR